MEQVQMEEVKKLFHQKYLDWLQNMNSKEWENVQYYAGVYKMHIAEYMYLCLEITANDIKKVGYNSQLWREIKELHKQKILASNCHKQEHGHVDKWWITKKGLKYFDVVKKPNNAE